MSEKIKPYQVLTGDALSVLRSMPDESVNCIVTSPPYWGLRSYLPDGVKLKDDAPESVKAELLSLGILPIDDTSG